MGLFLEDTLYHQYRGADGRNVLDMDDVRGVAGSAGARHAVSNHLFLLWITQRPL